LAATLLEMGIIAGFLLGVVAELIVGVATFTLGMSGLTFEEAGLTATAGEKTRFSHLELGLAEPGVPDCPTCVVVFTLAGVKAFDGVGFFATNTGVFAFPRNVFLHSVTDVGVFALTGPASYICEKRKKKVKYACIYNHL
jgi:hypothetical protein